MRPRAGDAPCPLHLPGQRVEGDHTGWFENVDQEAVALLIEDAPARASRQCGNADEPSRLRVEQPGLPVANVGHQEALPVGVPGEAIRPGTHAQCPQRLGRSHRQHEHRTAAACSSEDQALLLSAEDTARLWAIGHRGQVPERTAIHDLDTVIGGVGHIQRPTRPMHIAVVEAAGGMRRQVHEPLQDQRHLGLPGALLAEGVEGVVDDRLGRQLLEIILVQTAEAVGDRFQAP